MYRNPIFHLLHGLNPYHLLKSHFTQNKNIHSPTKTFIIFNCCQVIHLIKNQIQHENVPHYQEVFFLRLMYNYYLSNSKNWTFIPHHPTSHLWRQEWPNLSENTRGKELESKKHSFHFHSPLLFIKAIRTVNSWFWHMVWRRKHGAGSSQPKQHESRHIKRCVQITQFINTQLLFPLDTSKKYLARSLVQFSLLKFKSTNIYNQNFHCRDS